MIDLTPACDAMNQLLAAVTEPQLGDDTPCAAMSVGDLIDHVDSASRSFTALAGHVALGRGSPPDAQHLGDDWRDTVPQHVKELGQAWNDPAAWEGSTTGTPPGMSNELCIQVRKDIEDRIGLEEFYRIEQETVESRA